MTIRAKTTTRQRVIDLDGPAGNAFALLGCASQTFKELGWSKDQIDSVMNDMKSGDYQHLLDVFDLHLGSIYVLERTDPSFEDEEEDMY